ncbi:MAG TPA: S8 family serine peptidase, partial [Blastocatellia bacterium]|nr:S8 family serine peptidase [Blastocatellia bacterium]
MNRITSPRAVALFALLFIVQNSITALAGIQFTPGQGVVLTGIDGVVLTGIDGVVLTGIDGVVLTGIDGVVLTGIDDAPLTGADAFTYTGTDSLLPTGADSTGIKSIDSELALALNLLPDSSAINVFVVFYQVPTEDDLNALRAAGIVGGTRFRNLPMVIVNATRGQIAAISTLPSVRSIYSNKTFEFFADDTRVITGQRDVINDQRLTSRNGGLPVSGQGVTVAVIDTGIDATHSDLTFGQQVIQNVRVADLQGSAPAFIYPVGAEGLNDTDLMMGHGTLVASIIAGSGAASGNYYGGMAPGAKLLGISGGDASLFFVLSAMDYVLSHRVEQNIRVVNCSFGISGVFDANDPVNVATKVLHDSGISVVFSAGNRGNQPNSLNPYSVAPWVIGVGATTKSGSLCSFSSRGAAGYGAFYPTLVAPGQAIVGARALGINVVGTSGLSAGLASPDNDLQTIPPAYLPRYTSSSGTSFAAPHVAGTIALMLEANPALGVDQIKNILQDTATPMLGYARYEVGAGWLNTYAAVREAAFDLPYGAFRKQLSQPGMSLSRSSLSGFSGTVAPGATWSGTLDVPADAVFATALLNWQNSSLPGNKLTLTLSRATTNVQAAPSAALLGPASQKTGITLNDPEAGRWTIKVTNTGDAVTGTSQQFNGAVEVVRTASTVGGLDQLSLTDKQAALRALRCGMMTTQGNEFAPYNSATRLQVARALMLGANTRVPQYLPYTPTYTDVSGVNAIFAESIAHSPLGDLLNTSGTRFNPNAQTDRLTVAIALVKALGLESEARSASAANPGLLDWLGIPLASRGYVSLAVTRGLM